MSPPRPEAPVEVSARALTDAAAEILRAVGVPEAAALTVADSLVEADLGGIASHGITLLPLYVERIRCGSVDPTAEPAIVSDRAAIVVLDGRHALGQLVGDRAIELAVERAGRFGLGLVAVRHGFHYGAARRYAIEAAAAGCAGIVMCNTRPLMPAPGGAERLVGNNPLTIALPVAGEAPFVLDIALSQVAMGKIRVARETGDSIPATWATDAAGFPTTDPSEAIDGMLLPVGEHKGFGLALVLDLLCGVLSSGSWGDDVQPLYGDPAVPYDCSQVFLAIDVSFARPASEFATEVADAVRRVHTSARAHGTDRLYHPGEPEWQRVRDARGRLRLDAAVADSVRRCAETVGVLVGDRLDGTTRTDD